MEERKSVYMSTEDLYKQQIEFAFSKFNNREIVIWGTRTKGRLAKVVMDQLGVSCKCFISSRPKTDTCFGLPLYTPEILHPDKHYVFLTTANSEVLHDLLSRGFQDGGKDFLYLQYGQWHDDFRNMETVARAIAAHSAASCLTKLVILSFIWRLPG